MKKLYIFFVSLLSFASLLAQNVGIGTATPNGSAMLDVAATDKGLLIPRMSKTQRIAIATPANGLLVFQNAPDSIGFYYYNSGGWVWLQNASGTGSGWSTSGNAGTDISVNFIGTTDNMPLVFKVNNVKAGLISIISNGNLAFGMYSLVFPSASAAANTAIGTTALGSFKNGNSNIALGYGGLRELINGRRNIGIGYQTGGFQKGSDNIIIANHDFLTLQSSDSVVENVIIGNRNGLFGLYANKNVLIGSNAGGSNIFGGNNVAVGDSASTSNTTGYSNVAIGAKALNKNIRNSNLVAVGDSALYNSSGAQDNTAIGSKTLFSNITGFNNTAVGNNALRSATNGGNTAIGSDALFGNTSGENNVAIGSSAYRSGFGNNNIAIGRNAGYQNGGGNNNTILGSDSRVSGTFRNVSGSVFVGFQAGGIETTNNKLYIENSIADKNNALIYGDFAADSLLLNAKTVVRNDAVVRGYTKLGGYDGDVPSIKMKELSGTTGTAASTGISSLIPISLGGVDASKILAVNVLVGVASNAVWIPPAYDSDPRLKYNYFVHTNGNLYIQNSSSDCTSPGDHICNKTVKIIITYKE